MPATNRKPLMRSLGEFFGHILAGVRAKVPSDSEARTVKRQVHEEEQMIDGRPVTLRRTTIEEVVVHPEETPR